MKKIVLVTLMIKIAGLVSAQVILRIGEYDSLKNEKNISIATIQRMRVDSIEVDKKYKQLMEACKKDTIAYIQKIKDLNSQLKANGDQQRANKGIIAENDNLKKANAKFRTDSTAWMREIEKFKRDQSKDSATIVNLQAEITRLKQQAGSNSQVQQQLADQTAANKKLSDQLKQKDDEIIRLKEQLVKAEPVAKENAKLKGFIFPKLERDVNNLVDETGFDADKADVLISRCEELLSYFEDKTAIAGLQKKLEQYKTMSETVTPTIEVLNEPYNKAKSDDAKAKLQTAVASALNKDQKEAITKYGKLLDGYCKLTNESAKEIAEAKVYINGGERKDGEKALDRQLQKVDKKDYPFLFDELTRLKSLAATIKGDITAESKIKATGSPCN